MPNYRGRFVHSQHYFLFCHKLRFDLQNLTQNTSHASQWIFQNPIAHRCKTYNHNQFEKYQHSLNSITLHCHRQYTFHFRSQIQKVQHCLW
ncbi:hypothetical protein FE810_07185 [Thalassotalea litorea]|uniref:Uncharacterized protein n=1 Tax=Thalassotalea litorea TaxID=2020715 RepID=A0A5R9IN20_9GAMM|nr:hypothetical protein FE810_07185 [Thalassotalea litorea]